MLYCVHTTTHSRRGRDRFSARLAKRKSAKLYGKRSRPYRCESGAAHRVGAWYAVRVPRRVRTTRTIRVPRSVYLPGGVILSLLRMLYCRGRTHTTTRAAHNGPGRRAAGTWTLLPGRLARTFSPIKYENYVQSQPSSGYIREPRLKRAKIIYRPDVIIYTHFVRITHMWSARTLANTPGHPGTCGHRTHTIPLRLPKNCREISRGITITPCSARRCRFRCRSGPA